MSISTYQPGPSDGKDVSLYSGSPDTNYGTETQFNIHSDYHTLMYFDVSDIPSDNVCTSATLYLYNADNNGNGIKTNIYPIASANSAWTESGATWNKRDGTNNWVGSNGCSTSGTDYSIHVISYFLDTSGSVGYEKQIQLDPGIVETWFGSTNSNYGIIFVPINTSTSKYYTSDYTTNSSYRPKLVIDHKQPTYTISKYQPDESSSIDTCISYENPFTSYGSGSVIKLANSSSYQFNGLIKFDLSAISSFDECISASLEFHQNLGGTFGYPMTINLYSIKSINSSWTESSASWRNKNGLSTEWAGYPTSGGCNISGIDYDVTEIGTYYHTETINEYNLFIRIPLTTSVVKTWFGTPNSNYGIVLKLTSAIVAELYFESSNIDFDDVLDPLMRPKLIVEHGITSYLRRSISEVGTRVRSRGTM